MENIKQAQLEMRNNYKCGATGILISAFMWLVSAFVANQYAPKQAIWILLIGGMLIHPFSIIVNKLLKVSGAHSKNNPLGGLVMEGTFFMLMCIPLAYMLSLQRTELFFQGMLMIIGGRYLTFHTIYGNQMFWILGAALGVAGYLLFSFNAQSFTSAITGAIIEITFGLIIFFYVWKKKPNSN
jgi:drug/metabolite transporter (DMT)-like permease